MKPKIDKRNIALARLATLFVFILPSSSAFLRQFDYYEMVGASNDSPQVSYAPERQTAQETT
jgi:hypothetical protein